MLDRLNEVMDHIEGGLAGTVDPAELARTALTSEYHLRRMFSALAGMPLSEYVRRRRMTVAGAEVLAGERTLLDIAVRYGYGSAEAFGRAFRSVHGIGAGEARRTSAALTAQPRLSFRLTVEGSTTMRYRIVEKPAFTVAGRSGRVPMIHEGVNPHIADLIRSIPPETVGRIAALSDQQPQGIVQAVVHLTDSREEGVELDYYHAVLTGGPVPEDLDALPVPAGSWAVFENSGPFPQALQHLWRDVFTQWFPSNPYESRPGPEILRVAASADGAGADAELWIPVQRTDRGL
ncbi:AraC family transcriptional regulator [Kitasatospora cinereorecta]|uniref:GyrI-like domain-containing protein n=1 Tax=Kitasatospora cinereorecta TaxID=285560 RepID=A0ABW0VLG5_9ACTN